MRDEPVKLGHNRDHGRVIGLALSGKNATGGKRHAGEPGAGAITNLASLCHASQRVDRAMLFPLLADRADRRRGMGCNSRAEKGPRRLALGHQLGRYPAIRSDGNQRAKRHLAESFPGHERAMTDRDSPGHKLPSVTLRPLYQVARLVSRGLGLLLGDGRNRDERRTGDETHERAPIAPVEPGGAVIGG